jgi:alkylation response protein AidB-like acyl-CoA dehydrogenase
MDLMPSDDLLEFERTVASWLTAKVPVRGLGSEHVTRGHDLDPQLWRECADMGWLGLGLPESAGGAGGSLVEEAVMFRELGRAVAPGPFLPTVLAGHLAAAAGDTGLASAIGRGEVRVAMGTAAGSLHLDDSVRGELAVTHARDADLVVVCDRHRSALLRASDCALEAIDPVDGTVSLASGRANGVAPVVSIAADTAPIRDHGLVLAAATAVGLALGVLGVAVEYAGRREQFGRPIGSYQAVKHPLADAAVRAEGADAQVAYASIAVRDRISSASDEAVIAKWAADDAARRNAAMAVQVHGAMGFTAEATPYRYVLRAHVLGHTLALRRDLLDEIIRP